MSTNVNSTDSKKIEEETIEHVNIKIEPELTDVENIAINGMFIKKESDEILLEPHLCSFCNQTFATITS